MSDSVWRFYVGPLKDRFAQPDDAAFQKLTAELAKRSFTLSPTTPEDSTKRAVFSRPDSSKIGLSSTGAFLLYGKSDHFLSLSTALKEALQTIGPASENPVRHTDPERVWCLVM